MVTVQIPTYNDPVVIRCLKSCLKFDYPKDRFEIIVADDSTDITSELLDEFVQSHPEARARVFRRNSRRGFKPGALNHILPYSKGEIIVVFDADFVPPPNFLKRIVQPFLEDERVAIVQSRMGYVNSDQNLITKLSSSFMILYYNCMMPLFDRAGITFFCGTHGAIRKDVLVEAGGWNGMSITEDTDLSLKILKSGYKTVYLPDLKADGEVPVKLKDLITQQMRWSYGNVKAFLENAKEIWKAEGLSLSKKFAISYKQLGNLVPVFVLLMTLASMIHWVTGTPNPFTLQDLRDIATKFLLTGGYTISMLLALSREKKLKNFGSFVLCSMTLGLVLSFTDTLAVIEALFGKEKGWIRTPKFGSIKILQSLRKCL